MSGDKGTTPAAPPVPAERTSDCVPSGVSIVGLTPLGGGCRLVQLRMQATTTRRERPAGHVRWPAEIATTTQPRPSRPLHFLFSMARAAPCLIEGLTLHGQELPVITVGAK